MKKAVLEGLLFVVGEEGLTFEQIQDVLQIDEEESKKILYELKHDYESIREKAREFVKNIVLPRGTWESVVLTDMFSVSKFKREIQEACNLCRETHPEWFEY